MKKKGLSMNLIMALTLTAVAVSVLLCANLVFMQTYRRENNSAFPFSWT